MPAPRPPRRVRAAAARAAAYDAAMLALDPRWLGEAGLAPARLAGRAGLAGPHECLPVDNSEVRPVFVGAAPSDTRVDPERTTAQRARGLRETGTSVPERRDARTSHAPLIAAFAGRLRWLAPVLDDVAGFVHASRTIAVACPMRAVTRDRRAGPPVSGPIGPAAPERAASGSTHRQGGSGWAG